MEPIEDCHEGGTQRQSDQRQSGSKGSEQINGACAEHGSQSCKTDVCIPENNKKLRQWQSWGEGEQNPLCFSVGRRLKWVIINRESRRKGQRGKSQFLKQGRGGGEEFRNVNQIGSKVRQCSKKSGYWLTRPSSNTGHKTESNVKSWEICETFVSFLFVFAFKTRSLYMALAGLGYHI